MQCSSSKSRKLQMISMSSIGCAFATPHSDWKRFVAFSLCGDMRERRCPWRVPDVDCCLYTAAKWLAAFRTGLAVCWAVVGALVSATMADLAAVSAPRSKQGCRWSFCLNIPLCCFRNELTGAAASDPPLSCCRESYPDSLLSTNAITSSRDALGPFSIKQSSFISWSVQPKITFVPYHNVAVIHSKACVVVRSV